MTGRGSMRTKTIAGFLCGVLACSWAWAVDLNERVAFEIAPQGLASALIEFSKQTKLQVMSQGVDLAQRQGAGVRGKYSISEALGRLLEGSGLRFDATGENTIAVTAGPAAGVARNEGVRVAEGAGAAEAGSQAQD